MQVSSSNARDVVQAALAKIRSARQVQIAQRAEEEARARWEADKANQAEQDDDTPAADQGRYEQLSRIMLVIELIAPLKYGATTAMVHSDVCNEYGQVCERTVYRDLQFLESLGLLDRKRGRFIWRDGNFRSIVQREVARSWRKAAAARQAELEELSTIAQIRRHAEAEGWTERAEA